MRTKLISFRWKIHECSLILWIGKFSRLPPHLDENKAQIQHFQWLIIYKILNETRCEWFKSFKSSLVHVDLKNCSMNHNWKSMEIRVSSFFWNFPCSSSWQKAKHRTISSSIFNNESVFQLTCFWYYILKHACSSWFSQLQAFNFFRLWESNAGFHWFRKREEWTSLDLAVILPQSFSFDCQ